TSPDSPASMVSPQAAAEEVDLDSLPALPSLVQFSTRGLLLVTTATSVVVAILFGLYPTLFRCTRSDVATAIAWSAMVAVVLVVLFCLRRRAVEAKTGRRYLRIPWDKHLTPMVIAALTPAVGINLGHACRNFGEGDI